MAWQDTIAALDAAIQGNPSRSVSESTIDKTYPAGTKLTSIDGAVILLLAATATKVTTRSVSINGDGTPPPSAPVGKAIRARLLYVGRLYDKVESEEHKAWRVGIEKLLRSADAEAAKVDGKPAAAVDDTNPVASKVVVATRLANAAAKGAPPLLADLLLQVRALDTSGEPSLYGEGNPDDVLRARVARGALTLGTLGAVQAIEQDARDWIAFAAGS